MNMGMGGPGGLGDMMSFMKQAQEQAARMKEEMARKLKETVVEGSSGGGMVKVKVDGGLQLRELSIDPEVIDPAEKEMLEDLITAAFNQALKKAQESQAAAQQDQLGALTQGMGGMPGMGDLSKLFGGGPEAP